MSYNFGVEHSFNYFPCRYGSSRLTFRGPAVPLTHPYGVVIGGAWTYGRFVEQPFSALWAQSLGCHIANLGSVTVGLDAYLRDRGLLTVLSGAHIAVVQVITALNASNSYYSVHIRRNDRVTSITPQLRKLFPEIDFSQFHFTGHLVRELARCSRERFELVVAELRQNWLVRMQQLAEILTGKTILLWAGDHPPAARDMHADLSHEPALITYEMLEGVGPLFDHYVEYQPSAQAQAAGYEGMRYAPCDAQTVPYFPNVIVHQEISDALTRACVKSA